MNAEPSAAGFASTLSGSAEPLYFESGGQPLFGWLHRSTGELTRDLGVVICQPFGYEALCGHRSVRSFAEAIADSGAPCLRFDYAGTGDSSDIDVNVNQVDAWSRNVADAIAELQDRTGVRRVCLLGFRLGALIATMSAAQTPAVESLILVAPILNGRRYLRELKTTRMAALLGTDSAAWEGAQDGARISGADAMEFSGYPMSLATMAALGELDVKNLSSFAPHSLCVIDRSDLPTAKPFVQQLLERGIQAEYCAFPGFVQMMMTAPQFAVVPKSMIEAACAWILKITGETRSSWPAADTCASMTVETDSSAIKININEQTSDGSEVLPGICERPVFVGTDVRLFGIVTEPPANEVRRRAVILLNVGSDYHIGASRMYVSLARQWVRRGYLVLRLDLAGLGDSATRSGRPDNEVFPPDAITDIAAAMDFIGRRYAIRDISLLGMCSGAYHALRAAVAGLRVSRILMVNPQNFFWKQGASLEGLQLAEVIRNPGLYKERAFSSQAWRRLLGGEVNLWRIVKILFYRPLLAVQSCVRNVSRRVGIRLSEDLGRELEELGARGVRMVFVFAEGEAGIDLLKIQGGASVSRLGERCRVHVIASADHTFSRSEPRAILEDVLSRELLVRDDLCRDIEAAELVTR